MILYFSETGNSKFIAELIREQLNDEIISMNKIIKENKQLVLNSEKPYIIVCPIYAWRLPIVVENLLKCSKLTGNKKVWFVVTMGSQSGNCDKYCEKICKDKALEYMGLCGIKMPDSYVALYDVDNNDKAELKLTQAKIKAEKISQSIAENSVIYKDDKTPFASLMSGIINTYFTKIMATSKKFYIKESCISCGKCEKICCVNNITLVNGKPKFHDNCIHCMGCINNCPTRSIEIKGKTENRGRYTCPKTKLI